MHLATVFLALLSIPIPLISARQHQANLVSMTDTVDYPTMVARNNEDCARVATEIAPALTPGPKFPPSLQDLMDNGYARHADACNISRMSRYRGADRKDIKKYQQEMAQWVHNHMKELHALWEACSDVPEIAGPLTRSTICSELLVDITSLRSFNQGPRATGMPIVGAAIAAGVLAVL
ncbi:hypothetical protein B0T25DRAFT_569660 [Lasiosphaeria hispida]|uniref:Uncharacterized protein n=1 Tax=Lasiosphaeria hispida TaxID=260671 RepID=A0AAJ0MBX3_9PEZI|nr:hypothetical protein B0T25DRAFT_569660 [Lasiosphaeria hispida]